MSRNDQSTSSRVPDQGSGLHRRVCGLRPLALCAASVIMAATVGSAAGTATADEPALPGQPVAVPATDVTHSDPSIASTAKEVVVTVSGPAGPQVHKLAAQTPGQARVLAADLDAQSGVIAEVNQVLQAPQDTAASPKATAKVPTSAGSARRAAARSTGMRALSAESYGVNQWGLAAVRAESAWQLSRGAGVKVAVIDTGVDASHSDLAGRVAKQINLVPDGATGDPYGHGTHVAGIIAASLDGQGVAGLANEVTILPVRVMDAHGTGDLYTVTEGIYRAVRAGAKVINLSLGTAQPNSQLNAAVKYAVKRGVTVVAAGGNEHESGNRTSYPAALPGVIAVSSVNVEGASSGFANTGSYIDIAAPGEDILSTVPGQNWAEMSGTSMAAPFVSATAALVRMANPKLSRAQVEKMILATAADDTSGNGRDPVFGAGLLRADMATAKAAKAPGGVSSAAAAVTVAAVSADSKLKVDVDPDRRSGSWPFRVQRLADDGSWRMLKGKYRTTGRSQTRTLDLAAGTYRVVVGAKYGLRGATSQEVTLAR